MNKGKTYCSKHDVMSWKECPNCELGGEKPSKELDEMVRDFTQVTPRPKSEVRNRILGYYNMRKEKTMKEKIIPKRFFVDKRLEIIRVLIVELQGWESAKTPTTEEFLKVTDRLAKII